MAKRKSPSHPCGLCGRRFPERELVPAELVRPTVVAEIRQVHPDWSGEGWLCHEDLNRYRNAYVHAVIQADRGELSALEQEVVHSLAQHESVVVDVEKEWQTAASLGERMADRVADFGGSWRFIIAFFAFLLLWMAVNLGLLIARPFDPYPFIFLNLMLSCLAAIQAPIIMMSQNRQEARDRLRARNDYQINLKAELEIRQLHEKLDHLLRHQWDRLIEIQEIQLELMNELRRPGKG
jgi:uncharacterized membrane protein